MSEFASYGGSDEEYAAVRKYEAEVVSSSSSSPLLWSRVIVRLCGFGIRLTLFLSPVL